MFVPVSQLPLCQDKERFNGHALAAGEQEEEGGGGMEKSARFLRQG
jgi:hypothetical protein